MVTDNFSPSQFRVRFPTGLFSSINKEKLFKSLEGLNLENGLLNLTKKSLEHFVKGLPPGHVLSCMLSNLSLKDFDFLFPRNYTRYSDDMMFGLASTEEADEVLRMVDEMLRSYELVLNPAKTKIIMNPTLEKIS